MDYTKESSVVGDTIECGDDCPVGRTAGIIDGKWTTLIVRDLLSGTKRYSELQRGIPGITPKMLSARLQMLEANGLVSKKIYPTIPPKTEYTLTPLGRGMEGVIMAMAEFGQQI